ncbi:hypothetical protein NE689_02950 [Lactonifactor longoviformis]|uniref:hypothetical protein n=1 Tax=Lactonifactor longoviformis TaxID=341220 RepID=UPI00210B29FE|nr:hypothetical protein [Lactonifactor longoviformis]MCQ4670266.1 hypothetical protein [Lactonifactor longoviformis]
MTKQKRGFWLFIFSLIPGAGELYMGFRRQGISIMGVFWGIIALSSTLNIGILMLTIPVLWFYSFFNVHNLASLSEEEFYSLEDTYLFHLDEILRDKEGFLRKYQGFVSLVLILMGASMLWNIMRSIFYSFMPAFIIDILNGISNYLPKTIIAVGLVALGVYLVMGKKKELDMEDDDIF